MSKIYFIFLAMGFMVLTPLQPALACENNSPLKTIALPETFAADVSAQVSIGCSELTLFLTDRSKKIESATAENSLARFSMSKSESSCAAAGRDECAEGATVSVIAQGKVVAVIEATETAAYLYSANSRGRKDESLPYLKFSNGENSEIVVRTFNGGSLTGTVDLTLAGPL